MGTNRLNVKNRIIMFIEYYEKQDDKLVKVDSKMVRTTRRELERSLKETEVKCEELTCRPESIQLGVLYLQKETCVKGTSYIYTHQLNG